MRGRPPQPKIFDETAPAPAAAELPECPRGLDKLGKEGWKELVAALGKTGILTVADRQVMWRWCVVYSRWRRMEKLLTESGEYGEILAGDRGAYAHPALHVANRALDQLNQLGGLLGLDPVSRTRLRVASGPKRKGVATRDRSKGPKLAEGTG